MLCLCCDCVLCLCCDCVLCLYRDCVLCLCLCLHHAARCSVLIGVTVTVTVTVRIRASGGPDRVAIGTGVRAGVPSPGRTNRGALEAVPTLDPDPILELDSVVGYSVGAAKYGNFDTIGYSGLSRAFLSSVRVASTGLTYTRAASVVGCRFCGCRAP